jgi:uncharacterized protein (DUF1778 family)
LSLFLAKTSSEESVVRSAKGKDGDECQNSGEFPTFEIDKLVTKWHHVLMQNVVEERRSRITARVSDNVRVTLEQAAELSGATVNQFVVQTAYHEARRLIERESVIRLSQKDARKILSLLDNPPAPNKRLKEAVKAFKGSVRA